MERLLEQFGRITLGEMADVRLMNRIDTKFVTTQSVLYRLLSMAHDDYLVQEIGGERNMRYLTTYFDTEDFDMFYVHQSGHTNRQKLRFRTYVSSNLQFMEVKTKNNHGRTRKRRMQVDGMDIMETGKRTFICEHLRYRPERLHRVLDNDFHRVTLVNRALTERLTIDTGLTFHNPLTGVSVDMAPLVIVELKRDGLCPSPVLEMLRRLRVFPLGFSKYCIGSALTNDSLRVNRFKPRLMSVAKIASSDNWQIP